MSPKSEGSASTLSELSSQLAAAVETAGNSVVAIQARRRIPSSGIVGRDVVIVSASHTVRRDDEIAVVLPNGDATVATVAGRDPATDPGCSGYVHFANGVRGFINASKGTMPNFELDLVGVEMACGEFGPGRLPEPQDIMDQLADLLK